MLRGTLSPDTSIKLSFVHSEGARAHGDAMHAGIPVLSIEVVRL